MTSYNYDTRSVAASRPVELYVFSVAGTTYRYTSREIPIVYGGNTYSPAVLVHNDLAIPTLSDTPELIIDIPTTDPMIQTYGFGAPPQSWTCTVYQYQITCAVAIIIWQGAVGGITVNATRARVRVPSLLGEALDTAIPNRHFGVLCSHVLFDTNCSNVAEGEADTIIIYDSSAVTASNFSQAATISTVSGVNITVSTVGGRADTYYKNGRITRTLDGEHRQIVSQTGTSIVIDYPFRVLVATNAVTLYAGCDKRVKTCRDKFNNAKNFGGHPDIPVNNPFQPHGSRWELH